MQLKDITCISDLYYVMGRWFTIMMFAISLVTMPFALGCCDSVFSFAMCGGIAFVGVAADYMDKTEHDVHYISAMISALCCMVFSIMVFPQALMFLAMSAIGIADKKRWLLWCELGCFCSAYCAILMS